MSPLKGEGMPMGVRWVVGYQGQHLTNRSMAVAP